MIIKGIIVRAAEWKHSALNSTDPNSGTHLELHQVVSSVLLSVLILAESPKM